MKSFGCLVMVCRCCITKKWLWCNTTKVGITHSTDLADPGSHGSTSTTIGINESKIITESKIHYPCKFFVSQTKLSIFIELLGSGLCQKRKNLQLQLSDWLFNLSDLQRNHIVISDIVWLYF